MIHNASNNKAVAKLVERLLLDDLEIDTEGEEPSIYLHCGRSLSLGEFRCVDDLAVDLYREDKVKSGEWQ